MVCVIAYNVLHYHTLTRKEVRMPVSEAQKRAKAKYDKSTRQTVFRWRLKADADIIERLDSVAEKTEYVRGLIRRDIRENPNA